VDKKCAILPDAARAALGAARTLDDVWEEYRQRRFRLTGAAEMCCQPSDLLTWLRVNEPGSMAELENAREDALLEAYGDAFGRALELIRPFMGLPVAQQEE